MQKGVAGAWRRYSERYMLEGNKCETCGNYFFPPRTICPKCRRKGKLVPHRFTGDGVVETYTIIHTAPEGFEDQVPYVLGIIRLEEGALITGQIVDVDPRDVRIGMPVKLAFRRISQDGDEGVINYGYKFVPRNQS